MQKPHMTNGNKKKLNKKVKTIFIAFYQPEIGLLNAQCDFSQNEYKCFIELVLHSFLLRIFFFQVNV